MADLITFDFILILIEYYKFYVIDTLV